MEQAASEFGINPRTLSARLRQAGIQPGEDRCFSTAQICAAVFGNMDGEKLRLVREQADKVEIENRVSRKQLIDVTELAPILAKFITAARQRIISNMKLDRDEKDKIISHLGEALDIAFGVVPPVATHRDTTAAA